jgi:ABC-type nitrate/sulfonate/bicarbonate transport system substrate-binding protein
VSLVPLDVGFVPLVDCASLVIAREMGFAAEEGVDLRLHRETSWAAVRDKLVWERFEAAHLLSPMPIAISAGIGGFPVPIDVLMVLSVNGDTIGVRPDLAARMEGADFADAAATGRALITAASGLRFGIPFPFSMHAALLSYWLDTLGAEAVDVRTVPPPRMADAMATGEIDAFCVGEPWGSVAVERGVASLVLPGAAIWRFAPEKVLAVRRGWAERRPERAAALLRAVWRAAAWVAEPRHRLAAAEVLARPEYVDVAPEIVERVLAGRLVVDAAGGERRVPRLIAFFEGAATFPWRSQAVWIADALARRTGEDRARLRAVARECFRSDLYRQALGPIGADLPGASEKVEGALVHRTAIASTLGRLQLEPDRFFDGQIFDPILGDSQ